MVVLMHRRRGGVIGVYSCEVPDQDEGTHNTYVGVYTPNTGGYYQDHHSNVLKYFSNMGQIIQPHDKHFLNSNFHPHSHKLVSDIIVM